MNIYDRQNEVRGKIYSEMLKKRFSALICWDSDGPAISSRVAARPKCSSSATETKYRS